MDTIRTYTITIETVERKAIAGLLSRVSPAAEGYIKQQLRRSLVNGIATLAAAKQEAEEVEQYAEQVAAKGEVWGSW